MNGYVITCNCGAKIDDFNIFGEWFCDCGERGVLDLSEICQECSEPLSEGEVGLCSLCDECDA